MNEDSKSSVSKPSYLTSLLILLAVIYVGFLLYQAIYMNYATNEKIKHLKADLSSAQVDKDRLGLLISYYKTSTFQELEARKKLGLKMPGEKVIKVEYTEPDPINQAQKTESNEVQIKQSNPQDWLDFLLGRDKI